MSGLRGNSGGNCRVREAITYAKRLNKTTLNGKCRRSANFKEDGYRPRPGWLTGCPILVIHKGNTFHRMWTYLAGLVVMRGLAYG
jgi:hypothetical protein